MHAQVKRSVICGTEKERKNIHIIKKENGLIKRIKRHDG
jgi:hypothetical protein